MKQILSKDLIFFFVYKLLLLKMEETNDTFSKY